MVSARLDGLINGAVQRTYLSSDDGFWADLVLKEFAFLEERGYALSEISFHQNGDSIEYRGLRGTVVLEFFPDGNDISAHALLGGGEVSFAGELDRLARERNPDLPLPPKSPLNRATISLNVNFWAATLRTAADELLSVASS
jgi:hypothetical protein